MQLKKIDILNTVYAVIASRGTDLRYTTVPGVVLSRTPWRSIRYGGEHVWSADAQGRGYGDVGFSHRDNYRGILVLEVHSYNRSAEEIERLAAELPQVAAGIAPSLVDRGRGPRPEAPEGYMVSLKRPQQVVDTWEAKLEHDRVQRERAQAARTAREAEEARQHDARAELVKIVGSGSIPFRSGGQDYVKLLAFAEKFHQAKLSRTLEDDLRDEQPTAQADRVDYDGLFRTREEG